MRHKTLKKYNKNVSKDAADIYGYDDGGDAYGYHDEDNIFGGNIHEDDTYENHIQGGGIIKKVDIPTFNDFYNLEEPKESDKDQPLYEIQYLTNPNKKDNLINMQYVRTDFLSLGNAFFFTKGENIYNTTSNSNKIINIISEEIGKIDLSNKNNFHENKKYIV